MDPITGQHVRAVLASLPRHGRGAIDERHANQQRHLGSSLVVDPGSIDPLEIVALMQPPEPHCPYAHSVRNRDGERRDVGATSSDDGRIPAAPIRRCRRPEFRVHRRRGGRRSGGRGGPVAKDGRDTPRVVFRDHVRHRGPVRTCLRSARWLAWHRDRAGRRVDGRDSGLGRIRLRCRGSRYPWLGDRDSDGEGHDDRADHRRLDPAASPVELDGVEFDAHARYRGTGRPGTLPTGRSSPRRR